MSRLRYSYPEIKTGQKVSYGGNQSWFDRKYVKNMGCGLVSAFDLLWYLNLHREKGKLNLLERFEIVLNCQDYVTKAEWLRRRYIPVIPVIGVPGPMLAWGLNRIFRKSGIHLRARWNISRREFWDRIGQMLSADIPVILSVGPGLPWFRKKKSVNFYQKRGEDYCVAHTVCGHYITVLELDAVWMRILSWGKEYYIRREEYEMHWSYSAPCFHNMIEIRKM